MSFDKTFCSSPWYHMRILNSGKYEFCRWNTRHARGENDRVHNIASQPMLNFFQNSMSSVRRDMLAGKPVSACQDCYVMEQHGKVSGRQRQLLKTGIREIAFEKTLASSPYRSAFDYSDANHGHTLGTVVDLHVDLGNYCNNACIFCTPEESSRLATEYKKLNLIQQLPPTNWCDDSTLVRRFVDDISKFTNLKYIHFLGGETVITPAFKTILQGLVDAGLNQQVDIGFTTNLNSWDQAVVDLVCQFQKVHLNMSVETLTAVNDYVRWPSKQARTLELLDQWVNLGRKHNWLMVLRITPTCLSVHEIDTVYEYAWNNNISTESCNFLDRPEHLRISVLPMEYRDKIYAKLKSWAEAHRASGDTVINTRDPNQSRTQIYQDVLSYLNYLATAPDESHWLPNLVSYLKLLESNRKNSILDYLPEYETLFRSAGY